MKIRIATPRDLTALAEIHTSSWQDAYRGVFPDDYLRNRARDDLADLWRQTRIEPRDLVLVAERRDVIGFIAVWCRPEPYINNLHVLPGDRSTGVGRRLMVAAAERLIGRGHATAFLWVFEDNRRAVRFYERLGGEVGERELRSVFGHAVPSVKVAWSDLSIITRTRGQ